MGFSLTIDRYSQIYISPEISLGKTLFSNYAYSLSVNWIDQSTTPAVHEMYNFLSGMSSNISGGYWLGVNWTGTGTRNSFGFGLYNPQVGGGVSYTPDYKWFIWNKK